MKEEMDRKVVYFTPESVFQSVDVYMMKVFFPICTLTWGVHKYVSHQETV